MPSGLPVAECLRSLTECYPDLQVRSWRSTQQGWDSVTLLVNDAYIFRFARRPEVAAALAREARLLPRLAERMPLAVPRFAYVCDDPAGGARFVGYRAIPGVPLDDAGAASAQRPTLARELGGFLDALHAFPLAEAVDAGMPPTSAADWRRAYRAFYAEVRQRAFPLLAGDERPAASRLWEDVLEDDACFTFAPTPIHCDLAPEHILYDPAMGRLTGVIDWGDATIGDPAIDFTGVYRALGRTFAEEVLAAYRRPVDASLRRRVRFYADVGPFHEIRFGQLEGDAAHVARGLEALRRRLRAP